MSSTSARPGYEDAQELIDRLRESAGRLVRVRDLGQSVQGRTIRCAILTDPAAPADDKQHVLVVAGQHGTEESGRAVAMALLEDLVSGEPQAAETLAKQVVACRRWGRRPIRVTTTVSARLQHP